MEDTLIIFGGSVKALGNGKVGGHLVLFGSPEQTDLSSFRDFFTPDTDFGPHKTSLVFYDHGLNDTLKKRTLASDAELKVDGDVGIWIEAQLALRDDYEKAVYDLAAKGKLGWSSGTAAHLVLREPTEDAKAHWIKTWLLGLDASLTPTPAEPRTSAIALKSWAADVARKGLLGEYLREDMTESAIRTLWYALSNKVYGALYPYSETKPTGEERLAVLNSLFDEFRDEAVSVLQALLGNAPDADSAMKRLQAEFALSGAFAKRATGITTERDYEKFLRDAGFPKEAAVTLASGWKALRRRDAEKSETLSHDDLARERLENVVRQSRLRAQMIGVSL